MCFPKAAPPGRSKDCSPRPCNVSFRVARRCAQPVDMALRAPPDSTASASDESKWNKPPARANSPASADSTTCIFLFFPSGLVVTVGLPFDGNFAKVGVSACIGTNVSVASCSPYVICAGGCPLPAARGMGGDCERNFCAPATLLREGASLKTPGQGCAAYASPPRQSPSPHLATMVRAKAQFREP